MDYLANATTGAAAFVAGWFIYLWRAATVRIIALEKKVDDHKEYVHEKFMKRDEFADFKDEMRRWMGGVDNRLVHMEAETRNNFSKVFDKLDGKVDK